MRANSVCYVSPVCLTPGRGRDESTQTYQGPNFGQVKCCIDYYHHRDKKKDRWHQLNAIKFDHDCMPVRGGPGHDSEPMGFTRAGTCFIFFQGVESLKFLQDVSKMFSGLNTSLVTLDGLGSKAYHMPIS